MLALARVKFWIISKAFELKVKREIEDCIEQPLAEAISGGTRSRGKQASCWSILLARLRTARLPL